MPYIEIVGWTSDEGIPATYARDTNYTYIYSQNEINWTICFC